MYTYLIHMFKPKHNNPHATIVIHGVHYLCNSSSVKYLFLCLDYLKEVKSLRITKQL